MEGPLRGAIKQRIQSSHMPPCHMVIATNVSSFRTGLAAPQHSNNGQMLP